MKKTIMVTGGAGYIGSSLVNNLILDGNRVIVIDNLVFGKKENINSNALFYKENILSKNILTIFKKENPDVVFHLAAMKSIKSSLSQAKKFAKININGSLNLLESAQKIGL